MAPLLVLLASRLDFETLSLSLSRPVSRKLVAV